MRNILNLIPLSVIFFIACGIPDLPTSRLYDTTLPSAAQSSQAVLGKGYDKKQERFAGDCVTGTLEYVGAPEASISFERSLSAKETSDSLGFAVGAKARFGVISGSTSGRFASESTSNEYSEATVYSAEW